MTISDGFTHDTAAAIMRQERLADVSPDAEKQRRRCLTIIDGLVSVTQQAWGVHSGARVRREAVLIGG